MSQRPAVITTHSLLSNSRTLHSKGKLNHLSGFSYSKSQDTGQPPQQVGKAGHRRATRIWQLYPVLESLASLAKEFLMLFYITFGLSIIPTAKDLP